MKTGLVSVFLAGLMLASLGSTSWAVSPAGQSWTSRAKKEPAEKKGATEEKKAADKKSDEKPFKEVIKDFEVTPGLFTLYRKEEDGTTYLEIGPDQFDEIFMPLEACQAAG